MRAYVIARIEGGMPAVGSLAADLFGYVLGAEHSEWGMYVMAGTSETIQAVDALADAIGICTVAQLDDTISAAKRAEIDAWADANFPSLPPVPASWTCGQVVDELFSRANEHYTSADLWLKLGGLALPGQMFKCLLIAPEPPTGLSFGGSKWKLIVFGDYALWEVHSDDQDDLVRLHETLYEAAPVNSLGLLAVVQTFDVAFYPRKVMDAFDHPASELLARRNRIATYLEGLGYSDTGDLRAATDEHDQMVGFVKALGYTEVQLWNAMH